MASHTPGSSLSAKYSKWDHIELSDDEEDMHPNIDRDSMIRLKRRTREEREEQDEGARKAMKAKQAENAAVVRDLSAKLAALQTADVGSAGAGAAAAAGAALAAAAAVKEEKKSIGAQIRGYERESSEIAETLRVMDKKKKWNVGNMSRVVDDRTMVTPSGPVNTQRAAGPAQELDYEAYVRSYEGLIKMYGKLTTMGASQEFLQRHPDLLNEHATGRLLLWTLELEMGGSSKEMAVVARQQMLLQYVLDLAAAMKRDPREALVPFFRKMAMLAEADAKAKAGGGGGAGSDDDDDDDASGEAGGGAGGAAAKAKGLSAAQGFEDDLAKFIVKLKARAIEKKKEEAEAAVVGSAGDGAEPEYEEVEMTKEERMANAPGGLDPLEVFETLPAEMQAAFQSQDIPALQAAVAGLSDKEAKYHIDRCAASGLWVPGGGGGGGGAEEEEQEEAVEVQHGPGGAAKAKPAKKEETIFGADDVE